MEFHKAYLDLVLVPIGLLIMFSYHLFLLYRYLNYPYMTVIGFENDCKRNWVQKIMQVDKKDIGIVLSVIQSNISAAIYLATITLTLSSLTGAWLGNSSNGVFNSNLIYGDTRPSTIYIKYLCLLVCFLLAFSCFIQAIRHFIHSAYLISTPDYHTPVEYIEIAIIRGGEFWSLGLRALYFALVLLPWFFGPIPMFATSIAMVTLLHYLDVNTKPRRHIPATQMPKSVGQRTSETTWIPGHRAQNIV